MMNQNNIEKLILKKNMIKTITILNVTKRYTKTGKGVNEVIGDDGQVYTIWDPDFEGQLKRNNQITGQVTYNSYGNKVYQTLREIKKDFNKSEKGESLSLLSMTNEILLHILAVNILDSQKRDVSEDAVNNLIDGIKEKLGILSQSNSFSEPMPKYTRKEIQIEDSEYDEEESIPSFKKRFAKNIEKEIQIEDDDEEIIVPSSKKKLSNNKVF